MLERSKSKKAFKKNIETEIKYGKKPKQAAAIAYSEKRKAEVRDRRENKIKKRKSKEK